VSRRADVEVTNPSGLHARPAARFVEAARAFEATLSLQKDGRQGNAKSLVSVLKLGIGQGSLITLEADGPDEDRAVEELTALLRSLAEAE
jgi:phosphotransferase system HPr (HPr) family protein